MKELTSAQVSTVVADAHSVDAAILSRFSARAFLNKPVEKSVLEDLLQVAARAPSGTNTQPWKVYVVQGTSKDNLVSEVCEAHNAMRFELAPTAELMAWDITALGLDHAQAPFTHGRLTQHMEIPNVWLERGTIEASDHRLLDSPLALAGQRCMATLLFASGLPLNNARANQALEAVRAILESSPQRERAAATMPTPQTLVLRALTPMVEPAMELMRQAWAVWRETLWGLPGTPPRLWHL